MQRADSSGILDQDDPGFFVDDFNEQIPGASPAQ